MMKLLLQHSALPPSVDVSANTPLMIAAQNGAVNAGKFLLAHMESSHAGDIVNLRNTMDQTALMKASARVGVPPERKHEIIACLLDAGAKSRVRRIAFKVLCSGKLTLAQAVYFGRTAATTA